MSDYGFVINNMTWSYSRVKSFEDCPYRWFLKYIKELDGKDMFFASYGKFIHELIEEYITGKSSRYDVFNKYLTGFNYEVKGRAPNNKVFLNYFESGLEYLKNIKPFDFNVLAVEKKVEFEVEGFKVLGFIDILGEKNKELIVLDNKARNLTPRSNKEKPTKSDTELDEFLKQLYIYSKAVEIEYKTLPNSLQFNCYRQNLLIKEYFDKEKYREAQEWFVSKIKEIQKEEEFPPNIEYFKCRYLCEMSDHCEYYSMYKR